MDDWFLQSGHGVRFEWGPVGAGRLTADVACLVVVDDVTVATELDASAVVPLLRDGCFEAG